MSEVRDGIGQSRVGQKVHRTRSNYAPRSDCGIWLKRVSYDCELADLPEMLRCKHCNGSAARTPDTEGEGET